MKRYLLAALLLAPVLANSQAATWPRNSQTGKVEFRGRLPWPMQAKTDEQQQELAQRWYWAGLAVRPFESTGEDYEPTYASLPSKAFLKAVDRPDTALIWIAYTVQLAANKRGLTYRLYDFHYNYMGSKSRYELRKLPLEQALTPRSLLASKVVLRRIRQKLVTALAGWGGSVTPTPPNWDR